MFSVTLVTCRRLPFFERVHVCHTRSVLSSKSARLRTVEYSNTYCTHTVRVWREGIHKMFVVRGYVHLQLPGDRETLANLSVTLPT